MLFVWDQYRNFLDSDLQIYLYVNFKSFKNKAKVNTKK